MKIYIAEINIKSRDGLSVIGIQVYDNIPTFKVVLDNLIKNYVQPEIVMNSIKKLPQDELNELVKLYSALGDFVFTIQEKELIHIGE